MKKAISVMLAAGMAVSLAACGGSSSSSSSASGSAAASGSTSATASAGDNGEVYEMRLANPNPVGDVKDLASIKFSELADKYTNGRVKITVYSGGQLGDARETLEGLGIGTNEIVCESIGSLSPFVSLADFDAVPYMYRDFDHYKEAFLDGELGEEVKETVGEQGNFKILGGMYRGAREVTSKKKFTTPDELKGLKIRVPSQQIYIDTWNVLGASPTPLALTETFTALQQNTVEAQENATIESYGFGFYDVCDYLIKTNHVYSTDVFTLTETTSTNFHRTSRKLLKKQLKKHQTTEHRCLLIWKQNMNRSSKTKALKLLILTQSLSKLSLMVSLMNTIQTMLTGQTRLQNTKI